MKIYFMAVEFSDYEYTYTGSLKSETMSYLTILAIVG